MEKDKLISLKEAAQISGYSPDYIGQLIRKGKLPGQQVFSNVAWMTTREAIESYMQNTSKDMPSKFSGLRGAIASSRMLTRLFQAVVWIAIGVLVLFIMLLFYVLSVTIDHRINQRYLDKIEHVQE